MAARHEAREREGSAGRPSAWEWLTTDKHPRLLPTPWLSDTELEDFVEALLSSERLLGSGTRHVQHVERWGVSGDKQNGIDFFGRFSDGTRGAWQVKQLEKLTRGGVRRVVKAAANFDKADALYLVYGKVATVQAREEMILHPAWTLIDRQTLTEMLHLLPLQTQRNIIERFWGVQVRRHFVLTPGDAMVTFEQFKATRRNPESLINDLGELAGRDDDLDRIARVLDPPGAASPQILIVSGPGGRGKTRLLIEALSAEAARSPNRVVTCLAPMRVFDRAAIDELHQGAGVIMIDDAHNDPSALEPLLAFARNRPDVQLILATRPSGLRAIQGAIARASFGPHEQHLVQVGEMDISSARALVKGLTADLDLSFGLRNYLAEQACHSPHVAVILTNLIRKRQISGSIAVNENLRRTVLARYQEVMVPSAVDGFDMKTVHRVIATYSCLQPDITDKSQQARIADFCELTSLQLAKLTRQLIDHGLVLDHDSRLRVVPDVLADQIVEDVAAFEEFDTGFAADLWRTFGAAHFQRLALTLGELDWRIAQRGGPAIMAPVWVAIEARLSSPYPASLCRELEQIAPLAATQPAALTAALERLRARLDLDEVSGTPDLVDPHDQDDQLYRRIWPNSRQTSRSDVRARLPKLYGRAAVNDPAILEVAVDALLALASRDSRPPHSYPEHPHRVLSDDLSNLASLPDVSYPERIAARVEKFCEEHPDQEAVVALKALKPLLAKEELETIQSALHKISFQPHLISETVMRPVRDQIRRLLLKDGISSSLTRAGAAVELLREALRPPHGYFGNTVGVDAVLAWEDDDLATISVLAQIVERTPFATLRRMVSGAIAWSAEHAESLPLQQAAVSLQYELDRTDDIEDALADLIIGSPWRLSGQRVERVPDLAELARQRDSRRRETEKLTEAQKNERSQLQARAKMESRRQRISTANEALAHRLVESSNAAEVVGLLGGLIADARLLGNQPSFRGLWQSIGFVDPALIPEVVHVIADAVDDHPLDQDLTGLIVQWYLAAAHDTLTWAADAVESGRPGVRLAIASFTAAIPWAQHEAAFRHIWLTGIEDLNEHVASTFLGSGGWYLHTNPQEAASVLLAHEVPPLAAAGALLEAWRYGEESGTTHLDRPGHSAMLSIAVRAGLRDFIAQQILTDATRAYPDLVLDLLLDLSSHEEPLPDDIHGLGTVFEEQPTVLPGWLLGQLHEAPGNLGSVLEAALNDELRPHQADALAMQVTGLQSTELITLVQALASLRLWVPNNLPLAEACVAQAEATGVLAETLLELRRGMRLQSWGWIGNESSELNSARDACVAAANECRSAHLRAQLVQAADQFQQTIDDLRTRERDDDW